MLNLIDEFTRECLAIRVDRKLRSTDVIDVLSDLFTLRGVPDHIRSDNGPEFIAKAVREWIAAVGAKTRQAQKLKPNHSIGAGHIQASVSNHFNHERTLCSRRSQKATPAAAHVEWRGLCAA